jgi:uncharacterized protein (DUF1697 family)
MQPRTYVAFVRAVMIGREGLHREVLIDMFAGAGADDVISYVSTGNVSFSLPPEELAPLIDRVEVDLEALLGHPAPIYVRTLAGLRDLLALNLFDHPPFPEVRDRLLTFCPAGSTVRLDLPFAAPNGDWSVFASARDVVFSVTRDWPHRQPQTPGGVLERSIGAPVTTRALSTVERIVARLEGQTPSTK